MNFKLLTEHHFEFLSLKEGCRGSSESTLVKMSNCWKSHAAAHLRIKKGTDQSVCPHRLFSTVLRDAYKVFSHTAYLSKFIRFWLVSLAAQFGLSYWSQTLAPRI